jgi:hypothetical protein
MPEIKNTFLAGKMNKSLDDRLVPEGEYRDALNIQVTKSEGADVGAVQNIKGNTLIANSGVTLNENYKVIGTCFDDQKNIIYWFVTDDTNHYVFKYAKNTDTLSTLISGATLNFDIDSFVQAHAIENYLFFTDGVNEPRKLDILSKDYTLYNDYDITVAKIAPQFAPNIDVLETDIEKAGNYIEEKFVRFGYRYKYSDNTYSVYSPFSNTVFAIDSDVLTEAQIQDAYSTGELAFFINKARTIQVQPKTPVNTVGNWYQTYDIVQIDILMKSSDSPAVLLVDSINVGPGNTSEQATFIYNSEKPKATLPENQLTRVYDNVPRTAVTQEIVGNRVVYGNFTQDFDLNTNERLPFTLTTIDKETDGSYLDYLGVKSNRTYEIGLVFSDDYGRTSSVMFGQKKSIYFNKLVQDNYIKQIALEFSGNLSSIVSAGFKYYSVVVKQSEQEYYNVYTPGFGSVDGRSYFALFGDNINKIPIDTSTYNSETNINTTNVKTFLAVENKTLSVDTTSDANGITIEAFEYTFESQQQPFRFITNITNVLAHTNNADPLKINGTATTINTGSNTVSLLNAQNPAVYAVAINNHNIVRSANGGGFETYNIGLSLAENSGADVYIDGIKKTNGVDYTYNKSALPQPTITFNPGSIPEAGQEIAVFLKYSTLSIAENITEDNRLLSLTVVGGSISVTTEPGSSLIFLAVSEFEETFIVPSTPFNAVNLTELKITGISIRTNFSAINEDIVENSSDLTGVYKIENNYLLAEVDGLFGVPFFATGPIMKYADLAVLETRGFESAIDIYYETATQGLISSLTNGATIAVNYYNCVNLKTPARATGGNIVWQESRIKGGFNEASMDYGVQAYFTNEDYGLVNRTSSLIYSGILNNNTKVNNTNQFPSGENIIRTLDPVYGSIQKLYADTDDLLIFQEEKVSQALIDKDIIYTAEGQGLTTAGVNVISQVNAYATNYGIGTNPESFAVYAGRKYFIDRPKGAVLRLSRDGITEISNYGMRSYFRDLLNNSSITDIVGSWDIYNKEYVLSIQGNNNITLGFDESNNGWTTRYSYMPEAGGSLDGNFYTFKHGNLYLHYSNNTHNNFYGQQYDSQIDLIFNQNPSANKNFLTFNYEGSKTWNISNIEAEQDAGVVDTAFDVAAYNINNEDLIISAFKLYDGKFYANIINQSAAKENEVVFGQDVSGIKGYFAKLKIKTSATDYKELFSVSTNYNINSY